MNTDHLNPVGGLKWQRVTAMDRSMSTGSWEQESDRHEEYYGVMYRAKVPGGWLVKVMLNSFKPNAAVSLTFYPDPDHSWDGNSLD